MKLKVLSASIASVMIIGAQGAYAGPNNLPVLNPNTQPEVEVVVGGASAQDKGIAQSFYDLCSYKDSNSNVTDNNMVSFYDNASATQPGGKYSSHICTMPAANVQAISSIGTPALSGDVVVRLRKRSDGGSAWGIEPTLNAGTANAIPTPHMQISGANCAIHAGANPFLPPGLAIPAAWYSCGAANLENLQNNAGVADTNPQMFFGSENTPPDTTNPISLANIHFAGVSSTLLTGASVIPGAVVLLGTPVINNLYVALQRAQKWTGALPLICAEGSYSEGCMPNLNRQQIASIFTGRITSWGQVKIIDKRKNFAAATTDICGNAVAAGPNPNYNVVYKLTDFDRMSPACLPKGTDGTVNPTPTFGAGVASGAANSNANLLMCRRTQGSGSQTIFNQVMMNINCANSGETTVTTGTTVSLQGGSGGVETCLAGANDAAAGSATAKWAIGLISTEFNSLTATTPRNYKFIKIDGYAPTLVNAANGRYSYWAETTWLWNAASATAVNPVASLFNANQLAVIGALANANTKVNYIVSANTAFEHAFGQAGLLAPRRTTAPAQAPSLPWVATNPVTAFTRAPNASSSPDQCRGPINSAVGSATQGFEL